MSSWMHERAYGRTASLTRCVELRQYRLQLSEIELWPRKIALARRHKDNDRIKSRNCSPEERWRTVNAIRVCVCASKTGVEVMDVKIHRIYRLLFDMPGSLVVEFQWKHE